MLAFGLNFKCYYCDGIQHDFVVVKLNKKIIHRPPLFWRLQPNNLGNLTINYSVNTSGKNTGCVKLNVAAGVRSEIVLPVIRRGIGKLKIYQFYIVHTSIPRGSLFFLHFWKVTSTLYSRGAPGIRGTGWPAGTCN